MRWFRVYDDAINDPKILKLPEAARWHWIAVLCIASKNDGILPSTSDMAISLRVTPAKVSTIIAALKQAGLIDYEDGKFTPHNWNGRQYKSDVSTERVKRFRNGKRNVSSAVSETPPETETETEADTKTEQKDCADAPRDFRADLFGPGLQKLGRITGKGPDACRSFVGKCLKAASDDAVTVLGLIDEAERNQVVDPSAWIAARLKSTGHPSIAKPLTEFQRKQQETNDVTAKLKAYANGGASGGPADRILSNDSGQQSGDLRGGVGPTVLAISGAPDRRGH